MEVTEVKKDGLKRIISVAMPAAELEEKIVKKLSEVQPTYTIKGFRKGKVPLQVLQQRLGDSYGAEILGEAIKLTLSEHLRGADEKPVVPPAFSTDDPDWARGSDMAGTISYEVMPEIPDIDFGTVQLEYYRPTADDEKVDRLLKEYSHILVFAEKDKGQTAEVGDILCVRLFQDDSQDPEETKVIGTARIELGKKEKLCTFDHKEFVSRKAGDKLHIPVGFAVNENTPELSDEAQSEDDWSSILIYHKSLDSYAEYFAGEEVKLIIKIEGILERTHSKVDDNMAKEFGANSLADLRIEVIAELEHFFAIKFQEGLQKQLRQELDKILDYDVPEAFVSRRIAELSSVMDQKKPEEGQDLLEAESDDLPLESPSEEESEQDKGLFEKKIPELAERDARVSLFLSKVAADNEITLDEHEIAPIIEDISERQDFEPEKVREIIMQDPRARFKLARLLDDKTLQHLLELVTINEMEVNEDEDHEEKVRLMKRVLRGIALTQGLKKLKVHNSELYQRVLFTVTLGITDAILDEYENENC
ncbi:MAG: trigger factor [Aestuariivita sp.]|nr:trigger factor [Aestuariivita sp.]MCY4345928.1 trigger factor [Aestuariivita sp.]